MSGAGVRLFFALWPPSGVKAALADLQRDLGEAGRPVPRERLHLTVLFVGDGDPERVAAAGARAAAAVAPARLDLDRIGFFARAGVVWVGTQAAPEPLVALHRELRQRLRRLGQAFDDKPLRPHVTLFRKAAPPAFRTPPVPLHWRIGELTLVASQRGAAGPDYRVLGRWPLGAARAPDSPDTLPPGGC